MAENLGSVYYTVDAETTSLLKAEAQVNKSIGAMVSRFEAADNATQSFIMTQESLGRTINAAGQVFDKHGKIVVDATKKYRQLAAESNTLRETLLKQTKVSNSVNHALAAQSRSFGQAGIQIQQFFGQVQTGTNFLVAFSQQSADLGFVLGMPLAGAIAGLTASLVSFLIPSIVESGQAMDNLKDAVSAADDVMETSQAGVTSLSDKVRELAQVSETAAKASLVSAWLATRDAINSADQAAVEAFEDIQSYFRFDDINAALVAFDAINARMEKTGESGYEAFRTISNGTSLAAYDMRGLEDSISSLSGTLDISKEEAFGLVQQLDAFKRTKSPEDIAKLAEQANNLSTTVGSGNKKLSEFAKQISELSSLVAQASGDQEKLNKLMENFNNTLNVSSPAVVKNNELIRDMAVKLAVLKIELEEGEGAAAAFAASQKLAAGTAPDVVKAYAEMAAKAQEYREQIQANEKSEREAETLRKKNAKEAASAAKKEADAIREITIKVAAAKIELEQGKDAAAQFLAEQKAIATFSPEAAKSIGEMSKQLQEYKDAITAAKNAATEAKTVTTKVEGFAAEIDPVTELQAKREKQLELVREYEALETADHQTAVNARKAIDDEYTANLAAAQEARFVAQNEGNKLIMESMNSLSETASSVLTGMITQTYTLKDAMASFANAIVNDVVNSLVQVGLQYVKNLIISESADAAILSSKEATAAATSATHTAAVAATVAELASLASAGAYAATAAIPIIGPAAAPAAAASALAATTGLGAAAISSAPIAGQRLYGGSTAPNSMYKVTEDGRAEMFTDGRDSFLMTGSRSGNVTSNGNMSSGGNQVNVQVNNNAPGATATASYDERTQTVNVTISELTRQLQNNEGKFFTALTKSTTARGRTS